MKTLYKKLLLRGVAPAVALAGAYLIIPFEGREDYYLDPVGIATVCYGHTGEYVEDKVFTDEECLDILSEDLKETNQYVENTITEPFISGYEKAAYLSFTYNLGVGNLKVSTMSKLINAGEHKEACSELVRWVYARQKVLAGLVKRRNKETEFCLGKITVEEYEESIREIEEEVDKELDKGFSDVLCLVPYSQLDYSCKYGGVFCPSGCSEYDLNKTYISYSSSFSDPWYSWSNDQANNRGVK